MRPTTLSRILLGLLMLISLARPQEGVQFALFRRGGALATRDNVNLTYLTHLLRHTELRYGRTKRVFKDNGISRRWKSSSSGTVEDHDLLSATAYDGGWFVPLHIGGKDDYVEADIDMLSPDFYTMTTTSGFGSSYNSFSDTHVPNDARVHPLCKIPSDKVRIVTSEKSYSIPLHLPMCTPLKASGHTLRSAGTILGLAPPSALSRLSAETFLRQIIDHKIISRNLWSVTLLDSHKGNLTLGGTIAKQIEEAKVNFQVRLDNLDNPSADPDFIASETEARLKASFPLTPQEQFRWVDVHGAEGWWTTLMGGVWMNGAKVLKDQPVLFDLQSPFILAPPQAVTTFYKGMHAAKRLPAPHDMFFVFPCLSPPSVALEFSRWLFPTMSGDLDMEERLSGPIGGRFSLGKLRDGSGYCVGAVAETRMGLGKEAYKAGNDSEAHWVGSGLKDMWVVGEPFFRGTGIAFDLDKVKIGLRTY